MRLMTLHIDDKVEETLLAIDMAYMRSRSKRPPPTTSIVRAALKLLSEQADDVVAIYLSIDAANHPRGRKKKKANQ